MTIRRFATTANGQNVDAIRLGTGEISATILTRGATLQDLRLAGTPWPLTLGAGSLAAYDGPFRWFGAVVGPVANRIGGARAEIDGRTCRFEVNEGPTTCVHSGPGGTDRQIWRIADADGQGCTLHLDLADGLGGFPGNRSLAATFRLAPPAILSLTLTATSDAPTLMNLANHSYWNLDGTAATDGHRLRVLADRYLPTDAAGLPGAPAPVAGTRFDLRRSRDLAAAGPLDHNFCLADGPRDLTLAAVLTGAKGAAMHLFTTAPGLQVYDGAGIDTHPFPGQTGAPHGPRAGVALEPQFWPDAAGRPGFPSILLRPGTLWQQRTEWHFVRR